jgi:hypothetical protein
MAWILLVKWHPPSLRALKGRGIKEEINRYIAESWPMRGRL